MDAVGQTRARNVSWRCLDAALGFAAFARAGAPPRARAGAKADRSGRPRTLLALHAALAASRSVDAALGRRHANRRSPDVRPREKRGALGARLFRRATRSVRPRRDLAAHRRRRARVGRRRLDGARRAAKPVDHALRASRRPRAPGSPRPIRHHSANRRVRSSPRFSATAHRSSTSFERRAS